MALGTVLAGYIARRRTGNFLVTLRSIFASFAGAAVASGSLRRRRTCRGTRSSYVLKDALHLSDSLQTYTGP